MATGTKALSGTAGGSVKTLVKLGIFIVLLAFIFTGVQSVLKLNMGHRGTDNVKGFYELTDNSVDVLIIGASTAFCTVDPIVLYEEYGITAYDFTSSAQPVELSRLFLEEALKTQSPKVVALELVTAFGEIDPEDADAINYGLTDLPFSANKFKRVMEMFGGDYGTALSYLIPMVQYKDRWQELSREDFKPWEDPLTMGAYTPDKISDEPLDFSGYTEEGEPEEIPERNRALILEMKELCESRGIAFITFKAPNVGWTLGRTLAVEAFAKDQSIPFVNYFDLMEELGIDPALDFRDNTHLNITGSRKTSLHFGGYLKANYELPDERGTQRGGRWQLALDNRKKT